MEVNNKSAIILWFCGKTSTGKSLLAHMFPGTIYTKQTDTHGLKWWDGYDQQDVIILDQFSGELKINELLQLTQKQPFLVKAKCSPPKLFNSKFIIITTLNHPEIIYGKSSKLLNYKNCQIFEFKNYIINPENDPIVTLPEWIGWNKILDQYNNNIEEDI